MRAKDIVIKEINMSPGSLMRWLRGTPVNIISGIEYEFFIPPRDDVNDYGEPDYDYDEYVRSFSDIEDFFLGGEGVNSRGVVNRVIQTLQSDMADWIEEQVAENSDILDFQEWARDWREEKFQEWQEEDPDITDDELEDRWDEWTNDEFDNDGSVMSQYLDDLRERAWADADEGDFLRGVGISTANDVLTDYGGDLNWPYYTISSGGTQQQLAEELATLLGEKVRFGGYQSGSRHGQWNLETDGSLEGNGDDPDDLGLELVSPPKPIGETLDDLEKVTSWLKSNGGYTNERTGLHMSMSVEGVENVDYLKLVLLVGDRYVLKQFQRLGNEYTRSAMEKLVGNIKGSLGEADDRQAIYNEPVNVPRVLNSIRKGLLDQAQKFLQAGLGRTKYLSVHVKSTGSGSYIEFRGPGHDWLGGKSTKELTATALRFARAMASAADDNADREEYAKKLYRLLVDDNSDLKDPLQLFAQYSAGTISADELMRKWADRVTAGGGLGSDQSDYEIYNQRTGEVVDTLKGVSFRTAEYRARNMPFASELRVREIGSDKQRQDLAQRIQSKQPPPSKEPPSVADLNMPGPGQSDFMVSWREYRTRDGREELVSDSTRIVARNAAEAHRRVHQSLQMQNRDAFDVHAVPTDPPAWRRNRDMPAAATSNITNPLHQTQSEWTGAWLFIDSETGEIRQRITGIGNSQADANRHASRWAEETGYQGELEVRPEMS